MIKWLRIVQQKLDQLIGKTVADVEIDLVTALPDHLPLEMQGCWWQGYYAGSTHPDDPIPQSERAVPVNPILAYRQDHDLTQTEFAKMIGVAQKDISRWENGSTFPGPENRRKLTELGIILNY